MVKYLLVFLLSGCATTQCANPDYKAPKNQTKVNPDGSVTYTRQIYP